MSPNVGSLMKECIVKDRLGYIILSKYGWEAHKFEVIEECPIDKLDERELYWKQYYNTIIDGLNCCYFDYAPMKGKKHSKLTKEKISKAKIGHICYQDPERGRKISNTNTGIKQSKETCLKKSQSSKGKPKPDGFGKLISKLKKGKPNPKISLIKTGVPNLNIAKAIIQYSLEGEYIMKHTTQTEAAASLGKYKNSKESIGQCCRKVVKTAFGHIWRFENEPVDIEEIKNMLIHKGKGKPKPDGFGNIISKAKAKLKY